MGIYSDPRGTTRNILLSQAVPDNISAPILEEGIKLEAFANNLTAWLMVTLPEGVDSDLWGGLCEDLDTCGWGYASSQSDSVHIFQEV